jgi:nondiscriminating glutamyl-tRNA synthetase
MNGTKAGAVRVRFAPSPTGYLHVGGARTAIFNWLYARHTGGSLVLRIEDTDVERSTRASEASLIEDLRWLGLDWDEGPDSGGGRGPYRQSERLDAYRAAATDLVDRGIAYPCFCTDEVLREKRETALRAGRSPHYDGTCRSLTPAQIEGRRAAGTPEVVRFRVPDETVVFDDLVRGAVSLHTDMVGDFVILRSNGLPTYNFAAAYDDSAMGITHVLRGEEHLSNTLRQILIYRATGTRPPAFAHLPLILAGDRSKLSKREGASSVGDLRARGFLPGAVVNYLALLGWSHPEEKEKLTREDLVESFTIDRINKSAAVYDPKKLSWLNGQYIRDLPADEWVKAASPFLPAGITRRYDRDEQQEILDILHEKVETLDQIGSQTPIFLDEVAYEDDARELLSLPSSREVLSALAKELASLTAGWGPQTVKAAFKEAGKATGKKGKELFFPIRAAVTGRLHGPDLARVTAVKGRSSVLRLIERAIGA